MGRRKNANPQKNQDGAKTEQLGGSSDRDLPVVKEPASIVGKANLPPPHKRRRIVESDDEDNGQDTIGINEVAMTDSAADAQLTIESCAAENGKNQWTIQLGIDQNQVTYVPGNSEWTLRQYRLLRTRCLSSDGAELNSSSVSAFDGAAKVLQHCESICFSDSPMNCSMVAKAIENGTLRLDCCRSAGDTAAIDISISLTERAFELCSADRLPLNRRASSKKYQSSTQLHHALAQLFPDSVVADVMKKQTANPITAKTVYNLIDNVKLQEYEENGGYDCKPMSIPGLVPTLRPYQEAAVKWMVEREQQGSPTTENSEWELAWVVLADATQECRTDTISDDIDGLLIRNREVLFLPEWRRRMQAVEWVFFIVLMQGSLHLLELMPTRPPAILSSVSETVRNGQKQEGVYLQSLWDWVKPSKFFPVSWQTNAQVMGNPHCTSTTWQLRRKKRRKMRHHTVLRRLRRSMDFLA